MLHLMKNRDIYAQLSDLIKMKNDQDLDHLTISIQKKKKKPTKPTTAQINAQMKQYLCHQVTGR